jgi:hypothetical protein
MRAAVYNRAIPNVISISDHRTVRQARLLRVAVQISSILLGMAMSARAADWNGPEQQLARKVLAVTGPAGVVLSVENRSSLSRRDSEIIRNGLSSALQGSGFRFVKDEQAAAAIAVFLSENPASYVWVAEIRPKQGEPKVVMVSAPRAESSTMPSHESVPLSLGKFLLWAQDDPILDVVVLEENPSPTRVAVLETERISLYRLQAGKWQQEQRLELVHARPWPRDLRGRLIAAKDHLLDAYLPGVICRVSAGALVTMQCRETDDPWPLVPAALSGGTFAAYPTPGSPSVTIPSVSAFYAPTRNYFTGALTPGISRLTTVSKFYSAALLPRAKDSIWFFAGTDGHIHLVDDTGDQAARLNWGSSLASLKTVCGAGWQVLATNSEEGSGDSIRAYEFPDHDPIEVSGVIEFSGKITALWSEAKGDAAVAVVRNRETESYEAFRLAITCSQ